MRLADHFLAARGTLADLGGFATAMGPRIARAQRFDISDDVARAAGDLIASRPSTLVAALPLCRLPYETMWLEYRGGLGPNQGGRRDFDGAPVPWKQGVLVEALPGGQAGFMTIGWMHDKREQAAEHAINISPISIYFDWRPDGDVRELVRHAHRATLDGLSSDTNVYKIVAHYRDYLERKWLNWMESGSGEINVDAVRAVFSGQRAWERFANDQREHEAMRTIYQHMMPGISPHGTGMIAWTMALCAEKNISIEKLMLMWEADMQGEGGWTQCFLAMLNSRNPVVESTPVDLSKLNKVRRKSGKAEFLPYSKTRLAMSRSQARIAAAHGVDRESARQHLVRGHFKIRRTGVYWWSPFLRGDASRGEVKRQEYEVR